jgi:hypothetical protein
MHGVRGGGAGLRATPPALRPLPWPRARLAGIVPPAEESGIRLRASMSACNGPLPILSSKGAGAPTCRSGRVVVISTAFRSSVWVSRSEPPQDFSNLSLRP